jgi:hypothetical protein
MLNIYFMDLNNKNFESPTGNFDDPQGSITFTRLPILKEEKRRAPRKAPPPVTEADAITGNMEIDSYNLEELLLRRDRFTSRRTRAAYTKRVSVLTKLHDQKVTDTLLKRRKIVRQARAERNARARGKAGDLVTESEIGEMEVAGTVDMVQQNVQDHVGETPKEVSQGEEAAINDNGLEQDFPLKDFLERPVSIYDSTYAVGTEYDISIRPWDLWSKDPTVRAKLSNFAYFRGNMHLRISMSGTPFHYGKFMFSYQPWDEANENLTYYDIALGATLPGALALGCYKGYLSQAPGIAYIDVKENEPLDMCLPFFAPKPQLRLYNDATTVITNATSYDDLSAMGQLRIVSLNSVKVANEDFDSAVSINIYAWCTDIELTVPTSTDIDITAESKTVKRAKLGGPSHNSKKNKSGKTKSDEYQSAGPLETVATAVSNFGTALSDIPVIGGFATATAKAAAIAAQGFALFGLSKPVVLEKPVFVKNNPYANGAVFAGTDLTYKLTADPKQELTIDQTLGGTSPEDCMAIKHLASRESYLTTFTWSQSDVAMQDDLFRTAVTPNLWIESGGWSSQNIIQPTACCFAVEPFSAWRGTMKFRFEFICSKFHRGKVLIQYEPNISQRTLINTGSSRLNQQSTVIVDLQETQNVELDIEWNNSRAWCRRELSASGIYEYDSPEGPFDPPDNNSYYMGYITIRPLNELVQPTDLATVPVNVFVSCPDLEVAEPVPDALGVSRSFTVTESLVTESAVVNGDPVTSDVLLPTGATHDKAHLMNYGEKIESFRAAMKRYTTIDAYIETFSGLTGSNVLRIFGNLYPTIPRPYGGVVGNDSNEETLWNYLRYAYVGMRGGIRYRVRYMSNKNDNRIHEHVRCTRTESVPFAANGNGIVVNNLANINQVYNRLGMKWEGSVLYHMSSNGGVEFELPYYSVNTFEFANNIAQGTGVYQNDIMVNETVQWDTVFPIDNANGTALASVDMATAEDFTFLRFQGAPFHVD